MTISIVIVDDHPVISHGLKRVLGKQASFSIAGTANNGKSALQVINVTQPDLVILDITLQGLDGISLITKIRETSKNTRVIMYTMHNSKDYIGRSFQAGALGYILKSDKTEELVSAINSVMNNKLYLSPDIPHSILGDLITGKNSQNNPTSRLTPREFEIASLIAQGQNPHQIADALFISPKTVRVHRTNIMHKLSCRQVHELLLQLRQYFPQ